MSAKGARRLGGARIRAFVGDLAIYPDANNQWSIGEVCTVNREGTVLALDLGFCKVSGQLPETIVAPAAELTETVGDVVIRYIGATFPSPSDVRLVLQDAGLWRPSAIARLK